MPTVARGAVSATPPDTSSTRATIVEAADVLFYQHGFDKTSFTHIADEVGISRGNFYYHFKSKDEILAAVIQHRAARTQSMLEAWAEDEQSPVDRLRRFADMMVRNREDIQRHGCPVGTLCAELSKLEHPALGDARMIFTQFRRWLSAQFAALGFEAQADALALHLLSRSQGIASLANAFHDEAFIRREVQLIDTWLDSLQPDSPRSTPKPASRARKKSGR
jgi:TetR/AcrR family transcriptional regulator, transcriptional repressor for nem operon